DRWTAGAAFCRHGSSRTGRRARRDDDPGDDRGRAAPRGGASLGKIRPMLPVPPLLVISDRRQARQPLQQIVEAVFAGGCRWFSLREKEWPPDERRALLDGLVTLRRRFGAVVTAHGDIEAVAAVGADGVHLPSDGSPVAARARLPGALIGASAHSAEEAAALL